MLYKWQPDLLPGQRLHSSEQSDLPPVLTPKGETHSKHTSQHTSGGPKLLFLCKGQTLLSTVEMEISQCVWAGQDLNNKGIKKLKIN